MDDDPPAFRASLARALASPTRASILRALAERAHTPAELARRVGVRDSTVHGHLDVLRRVGLVARRDDGRRWAYHELTPAAHRLLRDGFRDPLVWLVVAILLGVAGAWLVRVASAAPPAPVDRPLVGGGPPAAPAAPEWLLPLGAGLLALSALLLLAGLYARWWMRRARAA